MSQKDRIVVTQRGRPAAVMMGTEGKDWEDVLLQTSSSFWKLIEKRRKEPTISLQELKTRISQRRK